MIAIAAARKLMLVRSGPTSSVNNQGMNHAAARRPAGISTNRSHDDGSPSQPAAIGLPKPLSDFLWIAERADRDLLGLRLVHSVGARGGDGILQVGAQFAGDFLAQSIVIAEA